MFTNNFFLRYIVGCYQNRNPSQTTFLGIISFPKCRRNGLCWSHVLIRTDLQSTTQNSCFYDGALKLLHRKLLKISKKIMYAIEFPFNKIVRLYSTAYYRIKKSTTDTLLELQVFLRVLKILENNQEKLWEFLLATCKYSNDSLQPYLACF